MATCSSVLAWKISWAEEPGGLLSMKSQRDRHPGPAAGDTYSTVSYSDTGSSTGSHGTSTTVSSARVSSPCPMPDLTASKGVKTHLGSNPALGVSAGT